MRLGYGEPKSPNQKTQAQDTDCNEWLERPLVGSKSRGDAHKKGQN